MIPRFGWWTPGALVLLALAFSRQAIRRWFRRWSWRHALRTRRELGFRLNSVTVTRKQRLKTELLSDPELRARITTLAAVSGREEASLLAEVSLYLDEIIPNFNLITTYRYGKRLAGWLLRTCYRVRIGRSAEAALNRIPRDASVVYVMNHRSNADYLLVAFLLANRVSISYAVGEWARVWPLERLFRSFGSFFVRRRFRDPLYHAVLERYVQRAVAQGTTQGIFIEGGLSRDGRLQPPKLGLLDYMLRAGAKELVFIPVGINYDRVVTEVPITPVAAVAWVYQNLNDPAPGRAQVRDRMLEVLAAAQEGGLPLFLPRGSFQRAFDVGLRVLLLRRILVVEDGRLVLPAHKAPLLEY